MLSNASNIANIITLIIIVGILGGIGIGGYIIYSKFFKKKRPDSNKPVEGTETKIIIDTNKEGEWDDEFEKTEGFE